MEKQKSRQIQDPNLTVIAKKFMQLPWLDLLEREQPEKFKHINKFPGNIDRPFFSARFTLNRRPQHLAYAYEERLEDLVRFADVMTLHLWKYRLRGAPVPTEDCFNYSVEDACADLGYFEDFYPGYIDLMYELENHLLFMGAITPPAELQANFDESHKHSYRARRSAAGRISADLDKFKQHTTEVQQLYFDGLAAVMEEIQKLRADLGLQTPPVREIIPTTTCTTVAPVAVVAPPPPAPPAEPRSPSVGAVNICRCNTPRPIWLFDHRLCTVCGCKHIAGKSPAGNFANAPATWSFLRDQYCPECSGQLVTDGKNTHCLSDSPQGRRLEHNTGSSCGYKIVLNETPTPGVNTVT